MNIELVTWIDSYGCSPVWIDPEEIHCAAHYCFSVGYILKESDEAIIVAPHYSPKNKVIGTNECVCGEMTIPKVSIISRKIIQGE
jgi:hypothetical protein